MATKVKRRMTWWEVCSGDLARAMQVEYEKALKIAKDKNVRVKFGAAITIYPPDCSEEKFGRVSFELAPATIPKVKSKEYTTQLDGEGFIVLDGDSITDILQEEIVFEDLPGKTIQFSKEGSSND